PSGTGADTPSTTAEALPTDDLTVVGIGASAGGLYSLQKLLPGLPTEIGAAYVIVQHLAPKYSSKLPALLAKHTTMPVKEIRHRMGIQPNTLYITPPNRNVLLSDGRLLLSEGPSIGPKPSIDALFNSLAEEKKAHAVGIVLSGTGADGSHGIQAIKSNEGITMAQTGSSAKFNSMPQAAAATGLVDLILPPEEMGQRLETALKSPHLITEVPVEQHLNEIDTILEMIHHHSGIDFSEYKKNTIHRRIGRRMKIHRIETPSEYIAHLNDHPEELSSLYKDMLISVTRFFRDPQAFESLASYLRILFDHKRPGDTFRAWVPGCSTGEEAYSIGMLVADLLGDEMCKYRFQIFATDIDEEAVKIARKATYPVATVMDADGLRIEKYFSPSNQMVTVHKSIRDMVVLARHDLINDPSFMHLDLISCRNLLIYLNAQLQDKLLSLFHFCLDPEGLLFLGKSESIGQRGALYKALDVKWKLFQRLPSPARRLPELLKNRPFIPLPQQHAKIEAQRVACAWKENDFFDSLFGIMDCCAVLVDGQANIQYIRGDVSPYFKFPEGSVSENINAVKLARRELRFALQSLIRRARKERQAVTSNTIHFDNDRRVVRLKVGPTQRLDLDGYLLIVITPQEPTAGFLRPEGPSDEGIDAEHVRELEEELNYTREHLQATIEELETSTEELQALNEELQAANEELQATNEELETSNEELQGSNEELNTVNDELRAKTEEAGELLDSLTDSERRYRHLVDNMNEALMLCEIEYDTDQRPVDLLIRQVNFAMGKLLSIRNRHLPLRAGTAKLDPLVSEETLEWFESISEGGGPQRFELHLDAHAKDVTLSAYHVGENRIGVVCRDDTERNRFAASLAASERQYRELIETANSIIVRWDPTGKIRFINDYGCRFFGRAAEAVTGHDVATIIPWVKKNTGDNIEPLVQDIVGHPERYTYVPSGNLTKDGRTVWVAWTNKANIDAEGRVIEILAIGNDITALKEAEEKLRDREKRIKTSLAEKEVLLREIHHRVKNNMQVISSLVDLQMDAQDDDGIRAILEDITHRVRSMALVHEKLYQSGDLANVNFVDYTQSLLSYLWKAYATAASGIRLETELARVVLPVNAAVPCGLILNELVSNALSHAFRENEGGCIRVSLSVDDEHQVRLCVADDGNGLPPDFDLQSPVTLGLRLVKMLIGQIRATVQVNQERGTEFIIRFPQPDV
ncbi:MAG: chemotaxis protein CheB, partial [Desulfosarcinaceae bacterium]